MTIRVNNQEVQFATYPNGEWIVPNIAVKERVSVDVVQWHWDGDHEILQLAFIRGLIKQQKFHGQAVLNIDYLPYSRMDREQDGHCFSLQYLAQQINAMKWSIVEIVEPHSQVSLDLIERSTPLWTTAKLTPVAMEWMNFDKERDYLVLPDKGALARYTDHMGDLIEQCHVIVLGKDREFSTGKIKGMKVEHAIMRGGTTWPPKDGKALIIDDLSSRGGTFVGAAKLLRDLGLAQYVALLVTHMEPVGLTGELSTKLDRVFCTDTMTYPRPVPGNFEILPRRYWQ